MPMWHWYRLTAQFIFLSMALHLFPIFPVPGQAIALAEESQSDSENSPANGPMLGLLDFHFVPPQPTVRSELPYYAEDDSEGEPPVDKKIIPSPVSKFRVPGNTQPVVEEDGIPLLNETVVEDKFIDPGEETEKRPDDLKQLAEAGPEGGPFQEAGETGITPPPTEAMGDGNFVDPFDETSGRHTSEELRDPWESFNSRMFDFNHNVDRYVMKPVAKGYNFFIPPDVQNSLGNAFSNMAFAPRFLNNIFQGKFKRAGMETQRFLINTTIGIGGLFDVAKYVFNIEAPPTEDVGQTLAVGGVNSGPYLILPFFPPSTVRDMIGFVGDTFLNPLNYFIPIFPNLGVNAGKRVNERSINLETFEGIEESTVDLYGAVRSAYFDRRARQIQE